jgi:hypothetical protein
MTDKMDSSPSIMADFGVLSKVRAERDPDTLNHHFSPR